MHILKMIPRVVLQRTTTNSLARCMQRPAFVRPVWRSYATTKPDDNVFGENMGMDDKMHKIEEKMSSVVLNDPQLVEKIDRLRVFCEKHGLKPGVKPSPLVMLKLARDPEFIELSQAIREIFEKSGIQNDPELLEYLKRIKLDEN
ncbi:uncharacterized protein SOCG_03188 [Schizosaccharomyces octosporus yFS286]|uniref:Fungal protein n=1 Tax=Schizosaccharomyces octosporus (strain yFS286) TaxID=483514 RepID=S9Q1E3_SCHOY|nr:uncharacterized protein SOCG_03188 [Schizosaccharomyces octosporus yFS286]EPX73972.1 fungal protein [Schizosaccharomyces octosporus yFS286]